ncbi:PucR family transcriptional regulator ligand-binding domain-containing protein [Rhodococcus opacus]|nr:PucR family transcriptional regulator ligand-binding domain-containing protein [Rhodococcus opacus]
MVPHLVTAVDDGADRVGIALGGESRHEERCANVLTFEYSQNALADVLAHPSLAAGRPVVRAGADLLAQPVRWVHSSEVIDIAHLLRGGELLLTGGFALASADPAGLRRYVRELSARRVAGVAIETGAQLPLIPPALVEEASEAGLPVVELRGVVPFVEVAEAINGRLLVNESVQRLRRGDAVAHALSEELARGGGPDELLEVLARLLPGDVTLLDASGDVIAALGNEITAPATGSGVLAVPVSVQGVGVATLMVSPDDPADLVTAEAIVERAPAALAISLLRSFPPSAAVRASQALLRIACRPNPAPERLVAATRAAGMADGASYVGRSVDGPVSFGAVDAALHAVRGRNCVVHRRQRVARNRRAPGRRPSRFLRVAGRIAARDNAGGVGAGCGGFGGHRSDRALRDAGGGAVRARPRGRSGYR